LKTVVGTQKSIDCYGKLTAAYHKAFDEHQQQFPIQKTCL